MLWAMIRVRPGRLGGRDEVCGALRSQAVVQLEVPLHRARIDPRRDRGELVDRSPPAGPRPPPAAPPPRRARRRPRPRRRRRAAPRASRGDLVMPVTRWPSATSTGSSRRPITPVAPARKTLIAPRARRRRRSPAQARSRGSGRHAHHPFAEAGGGHVEGAVEARAHVLQRDHVRQLDQLALVEVRAHRREQLVGHGGGRAAHGRGVVEHETLELAELVAVAVVGHRQQLALAHARVAGDRGGDVDAELAVDDRRGPRLGEDLQALVDTVLLAGRLLEHAVADQHARRVGVDRDRVHVTSELPAGEPVDEPHERARLLGLDDVDPGHLCTSRGRMDSRASHTKAAVASTSSMKSAGPSQWG